MTRPAKMLISLPSDWKAAFERRAAIDGISLSEWVCDVCKLHLPHGVKSKLSERPGRGRPAKVAEPAG